MATEVTLHLGDCREILPTLPPGSIDAVITDPPYPHIRREYGTWTEAEWWDLMRPVVAECRRVLKPTGSAVFVLQPNSRRAGSMRGWLFEFLAWACREWNLVQDAWWWRFDALPTAGAPDKGLMRQSLKACVWLGPPDCYRDQARVLWEESDRNRVMRLAARFSRKAHPCGWRGNSRPREVNDRTIYGAAGRRGGVTPFNVLPISNCDSTHGAGAHGHSAGTPQDLTDWWSRYIGPPGGTVLDPFMGSGTTGLSALKYGLNFIGVESFPRYHEIAGRRLAAAADGAALPLFA